jgi:hypothetical protein
MKKNSFKTVQEILSNPRLMKDLRAAGMTEGGEKFLHLTSHHGLLMMEEFAQTAEKLEAEEASKRAPQPAAK